MAYYNPETGLKRCSICGEYLPLEHFPRNSAVKDGYDPRCKTCRNAKPFGMKKCKRCKLLKPRSGFVGKNCEQCAHEITVQKAVYLNGKKRCAKCRLYKSQSAFSKNKSEPDGLMVYCKSCRARIGHDQRVIKYRDLPNTLTIIEWQRALEYFSGCCAVCGRQLNDLFKNHVAAADHWIPLTKGGGTTALNIVPLCHGLGGCNNKKHNALPDEWLAKEFGARKAKAILKRVQDYFEWVKHAA